MTEQQQISRSQARLESLRPKTLPLAFAAIVVDTALAWRQGYFDPLVALPALITAGLLQILSNPANDYGGAVKGSDGPDRVGPLRGMQKGVITQQQMRRALIVTIVLICLSGLALIAVACHMLADFVDFLVLNGLSIIAAIIYTVGSRPCRYIGLDDISVLVFLSRLSVIGSWYLQTHILIPALILPAAACDLLAAVMLNVNDLYDINNDGENGKNTLVMHLGAVNARRYHACLSMGTLVCLALFNLFLLQSLQGWLFVLAAPLLIRQARYVMRKTDPAVMRPILERTVKTALLTNLLFVAGIFLNRWPL